MKKSSAIALAGALALTLGTQAVAAPAAKQDAPAVNKTMKAKAKTKAAEGKCGEGKCGSHYARRHKPTPFSGCLCQLSRAA